MFDRRAYIIALLRKPSASGGSSRPTYIGLNENGVPFFASVVGAAELMHEGKGES